jgi:four helix bundle suffix protein
MSVEVRNCPLQSVIVANAILLLLNVTCHFLDRQLVRLSADFENEGGFSERMYKIRSKERDKKL